ncbi:MAG: hypothetical protein ACT6QS_11705 [Flavobacteriales bacterium]
MATETFTQMRVEISEVPGNDFTIPVLKVSELPVMGWYSRHKHL